jgi:hypothetical protein
LEDWLPQGHLARFVAELVDEVLDLTPILHDYTEKRGYPPYDPRLMLRLLIYGYSTGVRSSRAIERKRIDDVGFRYLASKRRTENEELVGATPRAVISSWPWYAGVSARRPRAAWPTRRTRPRPAAPIP